MGSVGKLNLDELKKAREELDRERGIVTPPPAKKTQKEHHEEKIEEKNDYQSSESKSGKDESTSEKNSSTIFGDDGESGTQNFSAYDNFAPFEINDTPVSSINTSAVKSENKSQQNENNENSNSGKNDLSRVDNISGEQSDEKLKVNSLEELLNNVSSIDDLLKYDLDSIQLPDEKEESNDDKIEHNVELNSEDTVNSQEDKVNSSFSNESVSQKPAENKVSSNNSNITQPKPISFEQPKPIKPVDTIKPSTDIKSEPKKFESVSQKQENTSTASYSKKTSRDDEFNEYGSGFDEFEDEYSQADSYTETEVFDENFNEENYDKFKRSYDVDGAYGNKFIKNNGFSDDNGELTNEELSEDKSFETTNDETTKDSQPKEKYVPSADSIISERMINEQKKAEQEAENADNNSDLTAENSESEASETEEKKEDKTPFKKIDNFNFIDIIKSNSFMDSDKLTCIYGIDEDSSVICQNFKDFYNTAIFCEDEDDVFKLFSSIILSLTLKNVNYEMKFVICDSNNGTKFEYYNDLSYMFFNRVAKSNNEIIDTLYELTLEIDKRYENLAKINSPNIESFNDIMQNADIPPMPYVVVFFDHYQRAVHLDDSDMINSYLKYIVKFGRLVGIYVNVIFDSDEIDEELNHNLSTRVSFKTELRETSIMRIGKSGAERLTESGEYLIKSLFNDDLIHLKVPSITPKEVALLVKNIDRQN